MKWSVTVNTSSLQQLTFVLVLAVISQMAMAQINVRDYGAKGDNKTNDTQAIQAAFDAQRKQSGETVHFPPGSYRISDTIKMYSLNVSGDSFTNTRIVQNDPEKDIFYVEFAWRGHLRNIAFNGGAKHLNMRNIRVDQGLLVIENCSFKDSSDFAIWMKLRSNPMNLVIRSCHFRNCEQVLFTPCDNAILRDSWITTARMVDKAAIVAHGRLVCENIIGVPIVTGQNDRWIDNYGPGLTCRNFRFGGEFGGMTPVYNFRKLSKTMANGGILIEDSFVAANGSIKKSAVYCEQIPNSITLRNNILQVPALSISAKINLKDYMDHVGEGLLQYDLLKNSTLKQDNTQAIALLEAAKNRDTSPEKPAGQWDAKATKIALEKVVAKINSLTIETITDAQFEGHQQQTEPDHYIDLNPQTAQWDLDTLMDSTTINNKEYIAMTQAGDDMVFMRRAPNGPNGAWPSVWVRDVEVDLDKTPFLTWRQKDPGPNPFPDGYITRNESNKLDEGIVMPSGYAMRIFDGEKNKLVLLRERHTPPWFDYCAFDLRKVLGVEHGKRVISIKYYPLGVYITGLPGSGFAEPGEYQILDFLRLESE